MPKNKRPVPRKSTSPVDEDDDVLAQALADLALEVSEQEHEEHQEHQEHEEHEEHEETPGGTGHAGAQRARQDEFGKLVRNALRKKNDEVLYGAIERARYADVGAYQALRAEIEEAAATVVLRREGAPAMEVNAFAVPLFVHSRGGLKEADTFQDDAAFAGLVDSFKQAGLESPQAKVVLISHAYDEEEIERISYSQLNDMVRDAAASMSDKKLVATPALERSIAGWAPTAFDADDAAVELRFLLGFALKRADDPFYQAPPGMDQAEAYFDARMQRYRAWTEQAAPLVRRCLARDPQAIELNFLYQDLFFGAKEQALAELAMLGMMADINAALAAGGLAPDQARAVVAPADVDDRMVMRTNLYAVSDGVLLASSDKPLDLAADLQMEVDDIADALATIGVHAVEVALKFDAQGEPQGPRAIA